jgi:hypothetical protein
MAEKPREQGQSFGQYIFFQGVVRMEKKHLHDIPAAIFYAGPQRIGRGIAECTIGVAKDDPAVKIQGFLAYARVLVILISQGDRYRAPDTLQVVEPVTNLEFQRKQVGQVDYRVDNGKIVFIAKPAPKGFGRGPVLGRIDVQGIIQLAGTGESGRRRLLLGCVNGGRLLADEFIQGFGLTKAYPAETIYSRAQFSGQ